MDLGSAEVDRLLSRTKTMLESLGSARPAGAAEDRSGVGEAADGRVRVVAADGRVKSLKLDPRLMRAGSEELAEHVLAAVNAALDDMAAKVPSADDISVPDPKALAAQVSEIQEQSVRQLAAISQAISAAVRQAQEAM
jgi:DNA-binding protein YbaB